MVLQDQEKLSQKNQSAIESVRRKWTRCERQARQAQALRRQYKLLRLLLGSNSSVPSLA